MRKLIPVVALSLVAISGTAASAQAPMPISFKPSISAGVAVPTGDLGDGVDAGYTIGVGLDAHVAAMPLSWRAEAGYSHFDFSDSDGSASDASGRINAVYTLPSVAIKPYIIGGVGLYHVKFEEGGADDSRNKFGWNFGAGIDLPIGTIDGRLEARYHSVSLGDGLSKYTYVPITFGIRF